MRLAFLGTMTTKIKWSMLLSIAVSLSGCLSACAEDSSGDAKGEPNPLHLSVSQSVPSQVEIDRLTKQILLEEIELERFNIHYRLNVAKQGVHKPLRYFMTQEGNNVLTGTGLIIGVSARTPNFRTPGKLNNQALEKANEVQLVGQLTSVVGSSSELLINGYHELQAHKHGFGPKASREFVLKKRHSIEALMRQRDALVEAEKGASARFNHYQVDFLEGQILSSMKDISLDEFVKFHSSQRGYLAFQQTLYSLDILRNLLGAVGSSLAYESNHTHNRKFNYSSGVVGIVSGSIGTVLPVISRVVGHVVKEHQRKYVREVNAGVQSDEPELARRIEKMQQQCRTLITDPADRAINRYAMYKNENTGLALQMERATVAERKARLAATENITTGAYTGATKISNSIMYTISGRDFPLNARVSNILIGSGNIAFLSGNALAVVDNLRIQINHEIDHAKRKKKHLLTEQILDDRLQTLDVMEHSLKSDL
jgi:hypothetical protein